MWNAIATGGWAYRLHKRGKAKRPASRVRPVRPTARQADRVLVDLGALEVDDTARRAVAAANGRDGFASETEVRQLVLHAGTDGLQKTIEWYEGGGR